MRILEGWARLGLWTGFFGGVANEKNKSAIGNGIFVLSSLRYRLFGCTIGSV